MASEGGTKDSDRIVFNIGGTRHATHIGTLKTVPKTRLAWIADNHELLMNSSFYDPVNKEYFFDRHPTCFASILQYYRTGKLHYPYDVCGPLFKEELLFWGIDEEQMEDCCWEAYTTHRDKLEMLKGFKGPHFAQDGEDDDDSVFLNTKVSRLKRRIWNFLDDPYSSRFARVNAYIAFALLAFFILIPIIKSLKPYQDPKSYTRVLLLQMELFCNVYFALEWGLRFWSCPDKKAFIHEKMNWIDFFSLWSTFLALAISNMKARRYIDLLETFRIIRVFRAFRYNYALQVLINTLKESLPELMLLVFLLGIQAMVFAFCNYYLEGDQKDSQFLTIPDSLWWAFITMTTVGYGDISPISMESRTVGVICAICGLLMVALPVSVVATNFSVYYSYAKAKLKLPPKKKVKQNIFSNALNTIATDEKPTNGKLKMHGGKVAPGETVGNGTHGMEARANQPNGSACLPPIYVPSCKLPPPDNPETFRKVRNAVERMREQGKIGQKKPDLAMLVSVFASKGSWGS